MALRRGELVTWEDVPLEWNSELLMLRSASFESMPSILMLLPCCSSVYTFGMHSLLVVGSRTLVRSSYIGEAKTEQEYDVVWLDLYISCVLGIRFCDIGFRECANQCSFLFDAVACAQSVIAGANRDAFRTFVANDYCQSAGLNGRERAATNNLIVKEAVLCSWFQCAIGRSRLHPYR